MGGTLRFTRLHRFNDDKRLLQGVKITDLDGLREHVESELSSSLSLATRTNDDEYPRYEYLYGLYYTHSEEPVGGETYFIDNVYPEMYDEVFAGISNYTERFVVLAAQSFPKLNELLVGVERTPYVIIAEDGTAIQEEIEIPTLPNMEEFVEEYHDNE